MPGSNRVTFVLAVLAAAALLPATLSARADDCDPVAAFTGPSYPFPDQPECVAIADLNADGLGDLIVGSGGADVLSVALNDGHNRFTSYTTLPVTNPTQIVAGDIDADADVDLVVATRGSSVLIFRNNADGTFAAGLAYSMGIQPRSVTLADIDVDGDLDMAAAVAGAPAVVIRRNNGAGNFGSARTSYAVGSDPRRVAAADVNADGHVDLVVIENGPDTVSVLMNLGDGAFADPVAFPTRVDPVALAVADLDADGDTDLLVATPRFVDALMNDGAGTFTPGPSLDAGQITLRCIGVGNLDADSLPDLVVAGRLSDAARVHVNTGAGAFGAFAAYRAGENQTDLAIGDLDADGDLDVAAASIDSDDAGVFINRGDATFPAQEDYPAGINPTSATFGDLDADGDLDIATCSHGSGTVHALLNDASGAFTPSFTHVLDGTPRSLVLADLDADGDLDIVVATFDAGNVNVYFNRSDGTFDDPVIYPVGWNPSQVVVGDLDADADLDVVTINYETDDVSVLFNDGSGALSTRVDVPAGHHASSLALVDVDLDADLDIVFNAQNVLGLLVNDGTGAFGAPRVLNSGTGLAGGLVAGHLNADAFTDLVFSRYPSGPEVSVLFGDGAGGFDPPVPLIADVPIGPFTLADVDTDADLDLVFATDLRGVRVLLNTGSGAFTQQPIHYWPAFNATLDLGDIDADGDADMVVSASTGTALGILRNEGAFPPRVVAAPADTHACPGQAVALHVDVAGSAPFTFQWRKDGIDIPGAVAAVLLIPAPSLADAGSYDVVITNPCSSVTSAPATVEFGGPGCCTADWNQDAVSNSTDVSDFINDWFTDQAKGTVITDRDANGVVNSTDVSVFINDWFADAAAGCG